MEKTVTVPLNLEETGCLCHLMMANESFREVVLTGEVTSQVMARWLALYRKLANANDKLMGKI